MFAGPGDLQSARRCEPGVFDFAQVWAGGKRLGNISLCHGSGPVCIIRDGLHGLQNLCGRVRVRCPFRGSGLGLGIRTLR